MRQDTKIGACIWLLNTFSITASVSIYIYCAYVVTQSTGSVLLGSLVFSLQWCLPILLGPVVHGLNTRHPPRAVLVGTTLLSLSALPPLLFTNILIVPLLLALILGGLELVLKVTRLVALKAFVSPLRIRSLISLTATGQFVGSALGGLLFAIAPSYSQQLFILSLGTLYALALVAALLLPSDRSVESVDTPITWRKFVGEVMVIARRDPALLRALVGIVGVTGLLLGFHNVARVNLPLRVWDASESQVGLLQFAAAAAAVAGAIAYSRAPIFLTQPRMIIVTAVLSVTCMISATIPQDVLVGFVIYGSYIFCSEILFMVYQGEIAARCKAENVSLVMALQYMLMNAGMMSLILFVGFISELMGMVAAASLYGLLLLSVIAWSVFTVPNPKAT